MRSKSLGDGVDKKAVPDSDTSVKQRGWPAPQDYNEAVQSLAVNSTDPSLRKGVLSTDSLGLPRPVTGAFASVYKVRCEETDFALRCFLRNISDVGDRYAAISEFIQHDDLPYTVTFDFMKEGIRVNGSWFPALKMTWVEGQTLESFVAHHLTDRRALTKLAESFNVMCRDLTGAGIAHGDLQHGNIIVTDDGELRLVDYDGVFVPSLAGLPSNELGHRNYQHPGRQAHHFGASLDNFSAWLIYCSMRAIAIDPSLFTALGGGDDCLLFRRADYLDPLYSKTFAVLEKHRKSEVRQMARFIRAQLKQDIELIPAIAEVVPDVSELEPLSGVLARAAAKALVVPGAALPDWMKGSLAPVQPVSITVAPRVSPSPAAVTIDASTRRALVGQGLEPELQGNVSVPRRVYWRSGIFGPLMLQSAILLLILPLFLLVQGFGPHGLRVLDLFLCLIALLPLEIAIWKGSSFNLARNGWVAIGEITYAGSDHAGNYKITYEFKSSAGKKYIVQKRSSAVNCSIVSLGERVTVLYDPLSPETSSVIYKFCPFQVRLPSASLPAPPSSLTAGYARATTTASAGFQRALVSLIRLFAGLRPHNVPNPIPVPEPELNMTAPRRIAHNEKSEGIEPVVWQILMFVNPIFWAMIWQWSAVLFYHAQNLLFPAVLSTLLNGLFQLLIIWKCRRDIRLARYGTAVQGQVVRRHSTGLLDDSLLLVEYAFRTVDGRVFKRFTKVTLKQFNSVKDHDSVTVLYYDGPFGTESSIYKFSMYKALNAK